MFALAHFRKIFLVRFFGYFLVQAGVIILVLTIEPVISEELKYRLNQLSGRHQVLPQVITSAGLPANLSENSSQSRSTFGNLLGGGSEVITPVSTDFGIVIEKIGANARIVPDVDPSSERAYTQALGKGVAHARGSAYPGQEGNIYLFSHSVDAPWNIIRFNAIFYLLNKLEKGDRVIMFYQGRRFDYIVFDKTVTQASDTRYLTDTYDESVLTLQTCDPPGTLLNRLIIRAKLAQS